MTLNKSAAIILGLAMLLGLGFRFNDITTKDMLSHDEGISYLAATGHQGAFKEVCRQGEYPVGRWVPASEWKRFLRPEEFFCFKQIGSDLAQYDMHPPLYFWLLHIWVSIFGTHLWAGPILNLLITALIIIVLYAFARNVLRSQFESAVVVFVWALSPYVLSASTIARQYDLFALFSLLLCWRVIRLIERPDMGSLGEYILLFFITLGGALTHYNFVLVVAGCGVLTVVALIRNHRLRVAQVLTVFLFGYAAFIVFHPKFLQSFELARLATSEQMSDGVSSRMIAIATTLSQFFVHQRLGTPVLVIVAILLFTAACAVVWNASKKRRGNETPGADTGNLVIFFFLWNLAVVSFPYVTGLSMAHAMGARYLGAAWLFLGFIPVLFVRLFNTQWQIRLLVALCVWQFCYGSAYAYVTRTRALKQRTPGDTLKAASAVLVDSVARGILPRVFWLLDDDKTIFAASQDTMLQDSSSWVNALPGGGVYVSHIGYGNSTEGQQAIMRLIERRQGLTRVESGSYSLSFFSISDRVDP